MPTQDPSTFFFSWLKYIVLIDAMVEIFHFLKKHSGFVLEYLRDTLDICVFPDTVHVIPTKLNFSPHRLAPGRVSDDLRQSTLFILLHIISVSSLGKRNWSNFFILGFAYIPFVTHRDEYRVTWESVVLTFIKIRCFT